MQNYNLSKKIKFSFFKKPSPKIGLALGGGGARGFAHLGALKCFEEYKLKFDYIAGTSVGALIGAGMADGKTFEQFYKFAKDIRTKDIKSAPFFLASKTEGLEELVDEFVSVKNIEDLATPYCAVAVDLKSTKEYVITKGQLKKAVAGSCAVPGVFQPVEFGELLLADGGLQDTIPSGICKLMGCDYVVAVDVNPQRGYGTDSSKMIDVLACSIRILMKSNALKGYINADVMIKPDTKRFKSTKAENIDDMIDEGYRATKEMMPQIFDIFSSYPIKKKQRAKYVFDGVEVL